MDAVLSAVVLALLPDHTYPVEQVRQDLRDVLGIGLLQLLAWFGETLQEDKVVLGLDRVTLDLLGLFHEDVDEGAFQQLQDLDDSFEFRLFQLLIDVLEVVLAVAPVGDLIQRTCILVVLLAVLVVDHLFDLVVPVVEGLF